MNQDVAVEVAQMLLNDAPRLRALDAESRDEIIHANGHVRSLLEPAPIRRPSG